MSRIKPDPASVTSKAVLFTVAELKLLVEALDNYIEEGLDDKEFTAAELAGDIKLVINNQL